MTLWLLTLIPVAAFAGYVYAVHERGRLSKPCLKCASTGKALERMTLELRALRKNVREW